MKYDILNDKRLEKVREVLDVNGAQVLFSVGIDDSGKLYLVNHVSTDHSKAAMRALLRSQIENLVYNLRHRKK